MISVALFHPNNEENSHAMAVVGAVIHVIDTFVVSDTRPVVVVISFGASSKIVVLVTTTIGSVISLRLSQVLDLVSLCIDAVSFACIPK